jgi:hypothetical protein
LCATAELEGQNNMEVSMYMIYYDFTSTFLNCLFSLGLDRFIYQDVKGIINLINNAVSEKTEEMGDIEIGIIDFLRRASQFSQAQAVQPSQEQSDQS